MQLHFQNVVQMAIQIQCHCPHKILSFLSSSTWQTLPFYFRVGFQCTILQSTLFPFLGYWIDQWWNLLELKFFHWWFLLFQVLHQMVYSSSSSSHKTPPNEYSQIQKWWLPQRLSILHHSLYYHRTRNPSPSATTCEAYRREPRFAQGDNDFIGPSFDQGED